MLPEYAEALCDSEDSMSIAGQTGEPDLFPSAATTPSARPSAPPSAPPSQLTGQHGLVADYAGDFAMQMSPVALGAGTSSAALDDVPALSDVAPGDTAGDVPEASAAAAAVPASGSNQGDEDASEAAPVIRAKRRTSAAEPDPLAQPPAATVHAPVLAMDAVPEGSMRPGLLERLDPAGEATAVTGPATGAGGAGASPYQTECWCYVLCIGFFLLHTVCCIQWYMIVRF